jgi:DNA-binding response OmpR family regulator
MSTGDSKILFVDDEETVANTLALIFSHRGYDTRAAYGAERALKMIAEWPPDLAILDVVLPQMNGVDLAILLTQKWSDCRILLFSGQALTSDLLAEAEKKGYTFAIVAKPIHPAVLMDRALEILTGNNEGRGRPTARHR